jgi:hypothetical protein
MRSLWLAALAPVVAVIAMIMPASADPITSAAADPAYTLTITKGNSGGAENVVVSIGDQNYFIVIPSNATIDQTAAAIRDSLFNQAKIPHNGAGGNVIINTVDAKVDFDPKASGITFTLTVPGAVVGVIEFNNTAFSPVDSEGNPSVFIAGLITNIGELTAEVSATDLTALDGATIAQALFGDLRPNVAAFGAEIVLDGDMLSFFFNPVNTIVEGGIVSGTTAPTDGVIGTVQVQVPEPSPLSLLLTAACAWAAFGLARSAMLSASSVSIARSLPICSAWVALAQKTRRSSSRRFNRRSASS